MLTKKFRNSNQIFSAMKTRRNTQIYDYQQRLKINGVDEANFDLNIHRFFVSEDDSWKLVELHSCKKNDESWVAGYYTDSEVFDKEHFSIVSLEQSIGNGNAKFCCSKHCENNDVKHSLHSEDLKRIFESISSAETVNDMQNVISKFIF